MPINVNTRYNNGRNISPSESTRQRIMNNISHNSNNNSNNIPDLPEASFNDVLDLSSSESPDTRESQRGCLSNPITSIINFFRNLNNRRELPVQQPNTQANN